MYEPGFDAYKHHIATYGTQDKFGYKDFIPRFKAEHFDPSAWAELFKKAGAKYVVPVAEHHDGFAMYDSGLSDWTAAKMGPHRDVIGDLSKAVRAEGLRFGVSSHRVEHDFFMGVGRKIPSDVNPYREHLIRFAEDQHTGLPPHAPTPCSRELPRLQDPATSDLPETRAKISR